LIERDAAFVPLRPNVVLEEWSVGGDD